MKIELKNVYFSERMSEETNAFTADVYVDGKKVAHAKNDGHGGCTWVDHYEGHRDKVIEMSKYLEAQTPIKTMWGEMNSNLENMVDHLFQEWLNAKDKKKAEARFKRDELKGLCIGKDCQSYSLYEWKLGGKKVPLAEILRSEQGRKAVREAIAKYENEHVKMLNTNIDRNDIKF